MKRARMLAVFLVILPFAGCAKTRYVEAHSETAVGAYPGGASAVSHGTYSDDRWWGPACLRPRQPTTDWQ
jgi:hypothetical protein